MKTSLWIGMSCWLLSTSAWADHTLSLPADGHNVNQLHEELLVAFPAWHGTKDADGVWNHPRLRVDSTAESILLTFPDDADPVAVQAVIAAHVPQPPKSVVEKQRRKDALKKLKNLGLTKLELQALFGQTDE